MPAFRRVEDQHAGPSAVGILVPPGQRTRIILRPRALPWDLLAIRLEDVKAASPAFCSFEREEAARLARQLKTALEQQVPSADLVTAHPNPWGEGEIAWLPCLGFLWLPCLRRPGQPYQGVQFATVEEAQEAARQITRYLCPGPDGNQEVYFNTQHFHH